MKAGKRREGSQIKAWLQAKFYRNSVQFTQGRSLGCSLHLSPCLTPGKGHRAFQLPNSSVIGLEARKFPDPAKDSLLKKKKSYRCWLLRAKLTKDLGPSNRMKGTREIWWEYQHGVVVVAVQSLSCVQLFASVAQFKSYTYTNIITHGGNHWVIPLFQLFWKILGHPGKSS